MVKSINIAQAYHITQNHCEAWLLQSLIYWQSKATISWKNKKWVVRTAREFVEEHGFPFNTETIGKGLRALKEKGLIEKRVGPHPVKPGILRATWVRISDEISAQIVPIEDIFRSQSKPDIHISEETSAETSEEKSTESHHGSSAPVGFPDSGIQKTSSGGEGAETNKKNKNVNAKLSAKDLYEHFRKCQIEAKHVPIPLPDEMTNKSFHKCRTLLSRFKSYGVYEPAQVRDITRYAVHCWASSKANTCRLEDLADELGNVLVEYNDWINTMIGTSCQIETMSPDELKID